MEETNAPANAEKATKEAKQETHAAPAKTERPARQTTDRRSYSQRSNNNNRPHVMPRQPNGAKPMDARDLNKLR